MATNIDFEVEVQENSFSDNYTMFTSIGENTTQTWPACPIEILLQDCTWAVDKQGFTWTGEFDLADDKIITRTVYETTVPVISELGPTIKRSNGVTN